MNAIAILVLEIFIVVLSVEMLRDSCKSLRVAEGTALSCG